MVDDDALLTSLGDALGGLLPPRLAGSRDPGDVADPADPADPADLGELAERLHVVVAAAHEILRARSVGLLLLDVEGGVRIAASSASSAEVFERRQTELGVGPGLDVLAGPEPIVVDDLCTDRRWPSLHEVGVTEGIHGVLSVPLVIGPAVAGNLNVIRSAPDDWTDHDVGAARVYAELIGVLLSLASQAAS